jgi:hypothetical protein
VHSYISTALLRALEGFSYLVEVGCQVSWLACASRACICCIMDSMWRVGKSECERRSLRWYSCRQWCWRASAELLILGSRTVNVLSNISSSGGTPQHLQSLLSCEDICTLAHDDLHLMRSLPVLRVMISDALTNMKRYVIVLMFGLQVTCLCALELAVWLWLWSLFLCTLVGPVIICFSCRACVASVQ